MSARVNLVKCINVTEETWVALVKMRMSTKSRSIDQVIRLLIKAHRRDIE